MTALKPVGVNTTFSTSTASAQSANIAQQSDSIRIVAETAGVHVAIGTNPTATVENFYVPTTDATEISLGPVRSQRVVGVTTGATTIIDFPDYLFFAVFYKFVIMVSIKIIQRRPT